MESIFNFFESLFKNFTWGRFTFLIFAVVVLGGSVALYELYTGHFKLNRISTELEIVASIVELEEKIESLSENSASKKYFLRLMAEAEESQLEFNFNPGFPSKKIERVAFQSAPWVLLLVLILLTTKDGRGSALAGVTVLAAPFIILGYNLPEFEASWVIKYLYPWGSLTIILIVILLLQSRKES